MRSARRASRPCAATKHAPVQSGERVGTVGKAALTATVGVDDHRRSTALVHTGRRHAAARLCAADTHTHHVRADVVER